MHDFEVPEFHPTLKNVQGSWEEYVETIEKRVGKVGIAKIIPPKGWSPRKNGYPDDLDWPIPRPVKQELHGSLGFWKATQVECRAMTLAQEFRPIALEDVYKPGRDGDPSVDSQEKMYWRTVSNKGQLYGADVPGSLFDPNLKGWNLNNLDSLLNRKLKEKGFEISGVTTPYLYFGTWRSTFPWHTEDMDLASVNYLHFGAPKMWYCIPPCERERFETMLKDTLPDAFRLCPEFLRHKEMVISPTFLEKRGIPYVKVVQYPGEFIISTPGAYHSGFNFGYNCAESTNFATRSWIGVGLEAQSCQCRQDSVTIQMGLFLDEAPARLKKAIREQMASECGSEAESEDESTSSCDEGSSSGSESEDEAVPQRRRRAAAPKAEGAGVGALKPGTAGGRSMGAKGQAKQPKVAGSQLTAGQAQTKKPGVAGGRSMGAQAAKGAKALPKPPPLPAGKPAPKTPTGNLAQKAPAGKAAPKAPAGKPALKAPTGKPAQKAPAGKPAQKVPAGKTAQKAQAGQPAVATKQAKDASSKHAKDASGSGKVQVGKVAGPPAKAVVPPSKAKLPAKPALRPAPTRQPVVVTTSTSRRMGVPGSRSRTLAALQARREAGILWEKPKSRYARPSPAVGAATNPKPVKKPTAPPPVASSPRAETTDKGPALRERGRPESPRAAAAALPKATMSASQAGSTAAEDQDSSGDRSSEAKGESRKRGGAAAPAPAPPPKKLRAADTPAGKLPSSKSAPAGGPNREGSWPPSPVAPTTVRPASARQRRPTYKAAASGGTFGGFLVKAVRSLGLGKKSSPPGPSPVAVKGRVAKRH